MFWEFSKKEKREQSQETRLAWTNEEFKVTPQQILIKNKRSSAQSAGNKTREKKQDLIQLISSFIFKNKLRGFCEKLTPLREIKNNKK